MSDIPSRLECLPNEILIYIFQHFDARELFRAFHHLNIRFNRLLQSLHYLSLSLVKYKSNDCYKVLAPYVYTLTIDHAIDIDLNQFLNIHRLILLSPTSNQLKQVVCNAIPYLEHLLIGCEHFLYSQYIPELCQKIFSDGFPRLKSCSLYEPRILEILPHLTQSTKLSCLKMDNIDILTYKYILSLCPCLDFFQFTILNQHDEFCHISPHFKLKRMCIKFQSLISVFSDCVMNHYLSCTPNLEQLRICEINFDVNMKEYLNFNWFASSIDIHLAMLRRFKYYLYIYAMKKNDDNVVNHVKKNFEHVHNNRYQSRLIMNIT